MPYALQFLIALAAGWVNRHQQDLIDYLKEENRVLRERVGGRGLRLTDDQRRRLAVKGKTVGLKGLGEVAGIVTPATIMRWYRKLVAEKYDGSERRGRIPLVCRRRSLSSCSRWQRRIRAGATPESEMRCVVSDTRSGAVQ